MEIAISKIIDLAFKIKKAADTARQNSKDCLEIKTSVEILSEALKQHDAKSELMNNSAVRVAFAALVKILDEALKLVNDCQKKRNIVFLLWEARNLSKQLRDVGHRISRKSYDAIFAIQNYQVLKQNEDMKAIMALMSSPLWKQNQMITEGDTTNHRLVYLLPYTDCEPLPEPEMDEHWGLLVRAYLCLPFPARQLFAFCHTTVNFLLYQACRVLSCFDEMPAPLTGTLLDQIAQVTLQITVAVETVCQRKEECIEIDRRVKGVSALLLELGLKNIEFLASKGSTNRALVSLLQTFCSARDLVMACKRTRVIVTFLTYTPEQLSTQLRDVLKEITEKMVGTVNAINSTITDLPLRYEMNDEKKYDSATSRVDDIRPDFEERPKMTMEHTMMGRTTLRHRTCPEDLKESTA